MKKLPYQTIFLELPDIEPLAKQIGAAPTGTRRDGVTPLYTVPIIHDHATGAVVSESAAIAAYLDRTYPSGPTLVPAGPREFCVDAFNCVRLRLREFNLRVFVYLSMRLDALSSNS